MVPSSLREYRRDKHLPRWRDVLILLALAMTNTVFAATPKIASDLQETAGEGSIDVIVQFTAPVQQRHLDMVAEHGGIHKATLSGIRGGAFSMPANAVKDLANDPEVEFISVDHKVQAHALAELPATINASTAWSLGYTGQGVGVAVIDSGINGQNQDLGSVFGNFWSGQNRVVYHEDFFANPQSNGRTNPNRYQTVDAYGHGTHVAGIIAGNGFQSTGAIYATTYEGIAPQANLIDLKVLDQNGQGSDSLVIQAIDRAIALKGQYNIGVINLSLGRPVYSSFMQDPLCQEVEKAWHAGIVVVVAAGNEGRVTAFGLNGYGTISAPGNDPYVLTVGATREMFTSFRLDDQITTYSSRGPSMIDHVVKPDLVAPGNLIPSLYQQGGTLALQYPQNLVSPYLYEQLVLDPSSSNYYTLSGTSMAAATSGAVAVLLSEQAVSHLQHGLLRPRRTGSALDHRDRAVLRYRQILQPVAATKANSE